MFGGRRLHPPPRSPRGPERGGCGNKACGGRPRSREHGSSHLAAVRTACLTAAPGSPRRQWPLAVAAMGKAAWAAETVDAVAGPWAAAPEAEPCPVPHLRDPFPRGARSDGHRVPGNPHPGSLSRQLGTCSRVSCGSVCSQPGPVSVSGFRQSQDPSALQAAVGRAAPSHGHGVSAGSRSKTFRECCKFLLTCTPGP